MPTLDVLIPTCDRPAALAVTLAGLCAQTRRDPGGQPFRVIISDQGDAPVESAGEVQALVRVLRAHGHPVELHRHLPRRGLAEQRQFLLDCARAPHLLFLDDDLLLEPWVVAQLTAALAHADCGFVGSAVIGLGYAHDLRPHEQAIEFWHGPVLPELVEPGSPAWDRHRLHNAANLWHLQRAFGLGPDDTRLYKIAWVGGCVLYDAARLRAAGGFGFWTALPREHSGEDVLAQLRVMARFGGCGVIPSGVYHLELPTTVPNRECDAPRVLPVRDPAPALARTTVSPRASAPALTRTTVSPRESAPALAPDTAAPRERDALTVRDPTGTRESAPDLARTTVSPRDSAPARTPDTAAPREHDALAARDSTGTRESAPTDAS